MAKKIKRFFMFLLFSIFFSLLSGRINQSVNQKGSSGDSKQKGWNSAEAECCMGGVGTRPDGSQYCL